MKALEAVQHTIKSINDAKLIESPFPWFHVKDFFPQDYFETMMFRWPGKEVMGQPRWYSRQMDLVPDPCIEEVCDGKYHYKTLLEPPTWNFWEDFERSYFTQNFGRALLNKTWKETPYHGDDFYSCGRLMTDLKGSGIGPHTDRKDKLVSMVVYMSGIGGAPRGTQLLIPKDGNKKFEMARHYTWPDFLVSEEVTFAPNTAVMWGVHKDSFHAFDQDTFCDRMNIKYFVQKHVNVKDIMADRQRNATFARDWKKV